MAERISDDFWDEEGPRPSHIYPWGLWFDGTSWCLEWGPDFCCSLKSFQSAAYHAATARGLRVHTKVDYEELTVRVQAYRPIDTTRLAAIRLAAATEQVGVALARFGVSAQTAVDVLRAQFPVISAPRGAIEYHTHQV